MKMTIISWKPASFIRLLIILLVSVRLHAQSKKTKKLSMAPVCGYTWQGSHNIDFGLQPMLLLDAKKDHSNLGLLVTGNLLYHKGAIYFTPMSKLRIMPHKRRLTTHLAWFASVGHSYTQVQKKYDHRITPELGIKWEWWNLTIGYNLPVSGYQDGLTNNLRVNFSLNLF